MAKVDARAKLEMTLVVTLTEAEAMAINEITKYGNESIIQALTSNVSTSVMEKHGKALDEFLDSMRRQIYPFADRAAAARAVFAGTMKAVQQTGD